MNPLELTGKLCIDIETAAEAIGMSETVVRGFVDRGLLPIVKFPGAKQGERSRRVLIAVEDLRAFVDAHRIEVAK